MASKLANLVRETTTGTGTGALTLAGAVSGYIGFNAAFGNGATTNTLYYFIIDSTNGAYEYGTGHMSGATTLSRDTVIQSSNANAAVNFSAGTKVVLNSPPQSILKSLEAVVGANGSTLSANSNDSLGVTWQDAGFSNFGYSTGRWYSGLSGGSYSTGALASGGTTLYVMPFYISERTTFTDVGVWLTAVGTATAMHMGIYAGKPKTGASITLVAGTDVTISTLTAGAQNSGTFTAPVTFDKGWYGIAIFANGSVTVNTLANGMAAYYVGEQDLNTSSSKLGVTGQTYGALPSPITLAITNENSGTPALGMKAQ